MATLVTPDDVLGNTRPAALTTQLWGSRRRLAARSLGSSVVMPSENHFALKGATKNHFWWRYGTASLALVLVGLVCWVVTTRIPHPTAEIGSVRSVDGLTIFAVFFVAALAIERLLEPLSNAVLPRAKLANKAHDAMKQAKTKATNYLVQAAAQPGPVGGDSVSEDQITPPVNSTPVAVAATHTRAARSEPEPQEGGDGSPAADAASTTVASAKADPAKDANDAIQDAANAIEALSIRQFQRATGFWAIATCLGMLVAAAMNLYFMNTVGITVGQRWEEILATGLIIGGGTKPLHDLVKLISKSSAGAVGESG